MKYIFVFVFISLLSISVAYDIRLDKLTDARLWRINGNYVYASSLKDGGRLTPGIRDSNATTKGVWYCKNAPLSENNENIFEISYKLVHSLYRQVWVRLLAHPAVSVHFLGPKDKPLGTFHSTGKAWCDAILSNQLESTFKLSVNLSDTGSYVIVDKVVLGISKITELKNATLNPCLGSQENLFEALGFNENYESLLVFDPTTTMVPSVPTTVGTNSRNEIEKSSFLDEFGSTLMRAPRDIIPTETTTSTSIDGAACSCTCTCSKPSD